MSDPVHSSLVHLNDMEVEPARRDLLQVLRTREKRKCLFERLRDPLLAFQLIGVHHRVPAFRALS